MNKNWLIVDQAIVVSYAMVFVLIGILSYTEHYLISDIISRDSLESLEVGIAKREMKISLALQKEATLLAQSQNIEQLQEHIRKISILVDNIKQYHSGLRHRGNAQFILESYDDDVVLLYFRARPYLEKIQRSVKSIALLDTPALLELLPDSPLILDIRAGAKFFTDSMRIIIDKYNRDTEEKINLLENLKFYTLGPILLVLILITLFIYRPFLLRVRRTREELRIANENLSQTLADYEQAEEERLRLETAVEQAAEAIIITDRGGEIQYVNPAFEKITGYSREEALGCTPNILKSNLQNKAFYKEMWSTILSGRVWKGHMVNKRKDGTLYEEDTTISPIRDGSGEIVNFIAVKHDVTLQMRAEAENLRLATAMERSEEGFVITDHNCIIVEVNPALERISGYDEAELLGKTPSIFKSDKVDEKIRLSMREAIQAGNVWNGHLVNRKKDGSPVEIDLTILPIRNGNSELTNYIGILRDVTYQFELEAQLQRSQKLEAVGLLAGGIAHDFNNILTPIMGYMEIALSKLAPENEAVQDLNRVSKAALRARELVAKIQLFSRTSNSLRQTVFPEILVNEVLDLLRSTLPANIKIHSDLETAGVSIRADSTQLHTMIMNLCINATQAMPDGGILGVYLKYSDMKDYEIIPGQKVTGAFVHLSISDTGQGMDKATQQRIFEPFFTTKEAGKGTGLGLSTAYGVIQQHGGFINVCSEVGEGSTFHVYLPIVQFEDEPIEISKPSGKMKKKESIHILFVDDETEIAEMGKITLESHGYRVTTFTSGQAALEWFRENSEMIDMVITDLNMADITGIQLAEELRKTNENIPIVLISGAVEHLHQEKAGVLRISDILRKPFTIQELTLTIESALNFKGESI